jgi:hypothetical protein
MMYSSTLMQELVRTRQDEIARLHTRHHRAAPRERSRRLKRVSSALSAWLEIRRDRRRVRMTTAAIHAAMSLGPTPSAEEEVGAMSGRPDVCV